MVKILVNISISLDMGLKLFSRMNSYFISFDITISPDLETHSMLVTISIAFNEISLDIKVMFLSSNWMKKLIIVCGSSIFQKELADMMVGEAVSLDIKRSVPKKPVDRLFINHLTLHSKKIKRK